MKYKKSLIMVTLIGSLLASLVPTTIASEKRQISLTNDRPLGVNLKASSGVDSRFLEGSVTLLNRKENRLVVHDQSILITPDTSFTSDKRTQPLTLNKLKNGSTIRIETVYEEGELKATSIHELD